MSETKARAAFEKWLNDSPVKKPAYQDCWHAAWKAAIAACVEAVEDQRLRDTNVLLEAYNDALNDTTEAIRALDGDGGE